MYDNILTPHMSQHILTNIVAWSAFHEGVYDIV